MYCMRVTTGTVTLGRTVTRMLSQPIHPTYADAQLKTGAATAQQSSRNPEAFVQIPWRLRAFRLEAPSAQVLHAETHEALMDLRWQQAAPATAGASL